MYQFSLLKQNLEVSKFEAVVLDVQHIQDISIRSQGSVSFVHPQYGGYVAAPQIFSEDNSFARLRIEYQNGEKTNLDIPQNIPVFKGDQIALFFVKNISLKKEVLGVLKNIETNVTYKLFHFQPKILDAGVGFGGLFSVIGRFFYSIYRKSTVMLIFALALFSLVLSQAAIKNKHHYDDFFREIYVMQHPSNVKIVELGAPLKLSDFQMPEDYVPTYIDKFKPVFGVLFFEESENSFLSIFFIISAIALYSIRVFRKNFNDINHTFYKHIDAAIKSL